MYENNCSEMIKFWQALSGAEGMLILMIFIVLHLFSWAGVNQRTERKSKVKEKQ